MKPINKDELYEHLSQFLRSRGVELKQGSYSQGIQKGCGLLTETINLGQRGVKIAKVELDKKLSQVRQVIHEKTAPKSARTGPAPAASSARQPGAASKKSGTPPRQKPAPKGKAARKRSG